MEDVVDEETSAVPHTEPGEATTAEVINLTSTNVEKIQADMVRMNQSNANQISAA